MNFIEADSYYIFGAGSIAKVCKKILKSNGKKIINFFTSQGVLQEIENIPVINLSENHIFFDRSIPVIIAVFNREENSNMNFISEYLKKLKFESVISFYDFFDQYSTEIGNLFWLTNKKHYDENRTNFLLVKDLFREQESLDIYDSTIKFLGDFDTRHLPLANLNDQYFPNGLNVWDGKNAFLDIGSFDGQTIMDAYHKLGKLETAIVYEPDALNISLINKKFSQNKPANQIFVIPCGVWSKTEILRFSSGGGESSAIQNDGDISIQCLSLDETLFGVVPGYIKMDIEGAEVAALIGAKNLITSYKPSLAISIYHSPSHLFEIPLMLKNWDLGYKFYLRLHGENLFDTVLYCVL